MAGCYEHGKELGVSLKEVSWVVQWLLVTQGRLIHSVSSWCYLPMNSVPCLCLITFLQYESETLNWTLSVQLTTLFVRTAMKRSRAVMVMFMFTGRVQRSSRVFSTIRYVSRTNERDVYVCSVIQPSRDQQLLTPLLWVIAVTRRLH
jgi:hypothetical protein